MKPRLWYHDGRVRLFLSMSAPLGELVVCLGVRRCSFFTARPPYQLGLREDHEVMAYLFATKLLERIDPHVEYTTVQVEVASFDHDCQATPRCKSVHM